MTKLVAGKRPTPSGKTHFRKSHFPKQKKKIRGAPANEKKVIVEVIATGHHV